MAYYWMQLGISFRRVIVPAGQPAPPTPGPLLYDGMPVTGVPVTGVYDPSSRPTNVSSIAQGVDFTRTTGGASSTSLLAVNSSSLIGSVALGLYDPNGTFTQTGTEYLYADFVIRNAVGTNPDANWSIANQPPSATLE